MKIYLDLSESKISKVRLVDDEKVVEELTGDSPLPLIDTLLNTHNLKFEDIEEFDSYPGPGSFTGLKVGATIANVLNWKLGNGKVIKPIYETKDMARQS